MINWLALIWANAAILLTIFDLWPTVAGAELFLSVIVLPLCLFWPGFVLQGISGKPRDFPALIAFSFGISLGICVPTGLLLNGMGRLDREGWIYALSAITIVGWLIGLYFRPSSGRAASARPSAGALKGGAGFTCAAVLAAVAISMAQDGALAQKQFQYSQFWMVPFDTPQRDLVTIGISNEEGAETRYSIDVLKDGGLIGQFPPFSLQNGQSRTFNFAVTSGLKQGGRIEAWLYKGDLRDVIYRKVWVSPVDFQSSGDKRG